MALGNTPTRLTNIFLEANKSFALNIRFKYHNGDPFDLTGHVLRLSADAPKHLSGTEVLTLVADHVDAAGGHAQFKFQALDLSLETGEYVYDVTLLSPNEFTTPILKGNIVIGLNAEEINDNVFTENVHTNEDVVVLFGTACDVEIRFNQIELIEGPRGFKGDQGEPTAVFIQDEPPPDPSATPPFYYPLWVDTDAEYTYANYVYEAPEPPPDMPTGVLYFDNDETNIPPRGVGVLYVKAQSGELIPVTGGGGDGGSGATVIIQPEPPPTTLAEGTLWVDEDSNVPPFDSGGTEWEIVASPSTFPGIDPTGITSSSTGLAAFVAAIPDGGTGVIPQGTYLLSTRLTIANRSVHIKAEGANFVIGSTQGGVKIEGSLGTVYNVTTVQETTSTAYGHSGEVLGVTNLTLSAAAPAWKRGDLVKVVADDIPVDPDLSGLRSGQSMTVLEVSGTVVTLAGQLRDQFTTTVRVAKWNDYPVSWTGGTFSVTDALLAGTGVVAYAMQTYATVETSISKVNVTSSASQAFQLLYCYAPRLSDINVDYAQDYSGKYGYGINDASEYTRVSRLKCRNIRHGYTTGAAGTSTANNPDITKHGRTYGGIVDNSIVVGSTQTAFDTHGDSDSISFLNCAAIDCYTGFGLRGTNHRVLGCLVRGYTPGTGITVSIASSSEFSYGSFIGGGTVIDGVQSYPIGVYGDTALAVETRPTYIDGVTVLNRNTSLAVVRVNHSTAWLGTINVPDGGSRMSVVNSGVVLPMPKMTNVEFGALTPAPVTYRNNAEAGQADGTVVTNANSGGTAGDAFPATSINGSPVFSTLRSYGNGTTSYRFATTDGTQMNIGYNPQDSEMLEASWNFYMEAFPTVAVALIAQIRSSSATSVSNIRIGTDGKVSVMKGLGTVLGTYATALTIGTWYRMEWMVARGTTINNGRNKFAVFAADSAVPLWTYYADAQDMGILPLQHCKVGKPQAGGTINLHIDNFMLKSTPPGL